MPFYEDYVGDRGGSPKNRRQAAIARRLAQENDYEFDPYTDPETGTTWYMNPSMIGLAPTGLNIPSGNLATGLIGASLPSMGQWPSDYVGTGAEIGLNMPQQPQQNRPPTPDVTGIAAGGLSGGGGGGGNPLLRRLIASASNVPIINYDQLIAENADAIRAAYRPQIRGLRKENQATNREFEENRQIISGLGNQIYRQGMNQSERAGEEANADIRAIQNEANKRASQSLRSQGNRTQNIGQFLQDIGAPEAADELIGQIQKEGAASRKTISREARGEKRIERRQGEQEERFLEGMAMGARQIGLDSVANLIDQKNAILRANRTGIQELKGARGQELTQMTTGLNMQEAQDQLAAESVTWDRLMQLAGLKEEQRQFNLGRQDQNAMFELQMLSDQQAAQEEAQESFYSPGYTDYVSGAQSLFGPNRAQQAIALLNQFNQEQNFGVGQTVSTGGDIMNALGYEATDQPGKVTPEVVAQYLKHFAMKNYGWPDALANRLLELGKNYASSQ